jgi:hypothetical protein
VERCPILGAGASLVTDAVAIAAAIHSAMLNSLAPMSFAPSWKDFFAKNGELTDKESILLLLGFRDDIGPQ